MSEKEIVERLEVLITLMIPPFNEGKYQEKGLQLDILRVCDFENTVEDMERKLKKSRNIINVNLSRLRSKGLIRSASKDGSIVYLRLR